MNKIYIVKHIFDVDGGFGDVISQEEVVCGFLNEEDANDFVKRYQNEHCYEYGYNNMWCGKLVAEELNMNIPLAEDMWWLYDDEDE